MKFTLRAATGTPSYPLPITQTIKWQENRTSIALGHVPAGHIIVPSFSFIPSIHSPQIKSSTYVFSLQAKDHHDVYLQRVPAKGTQHCARGGSDTSVSTHIDCYHTHKNLDEVVLSLELDATIPEEALLSVSVRPIVIDPPNPKPRQIKLPQPVAISQMTGPEKIRQRICSPTALCMSLSIHRGDIKNHWLNIVERCHDPVSNAYGSWPLAIKVANEYGVQAAVETFTDWQAVHSALAGGHPIVCSINFAKGKLQGAPLAQTSGHLVVLYGVTDTYVNVMDPAAASNSEVAMQYDIDEFSSAWLHQRGAAYIFSDHAYSLSH